MPTPGPAPAPSTDPGLLAFAQKLMTLLAEGLTTATYKYAVLLGLMDLCLEKTGAGGAAPSSLTTHELADKVIDLYWSQSLAHPGRREVLRQNSSGQAEIVRRIEQYRAHPKVAAALNSRQAGRLDPEGYARLRRHVEFKLAEMPLPRLQRLGSGVDEFLYRVAFQQDEHAVKRPADLDRRDFDNRILFVGNAAERLVALAPLLRPLIQREWTALVARFNRFEEAELEGFLFGRSRTPTATLRSGLREIQDNRCFYCEERIRVPEVDHFVPWARFPDDGVHNLVLADRRCNGSKKAHLAAMDHVDKWALRFATGSSLASQLATLATREDWERDDDRTLGIARGLYLPLSIDNRVWQRPDEFIAADPHRFATALSL